MSRALPLEALEKIKHSVGSYWWAAMFQQRPAPAEGDIFKREWFHYYEKLPDDIDEWIQSWDLAFTGKEKSAYTVGQVWARKGANKYLVDQIRGKWDLVQTNAAIERLTGKYPQARAKLIERAANGEAVLSLLKNKVPGLIGISPTKSKEDRALAVQPEFEAVNVWFPMVGTRGWLGDFIEEVATFPHSQYKDQVDTMVQALHRLSRHATTDVDILSLTKTSVVSRL